MGRLLTIKVMIAGLLLTGCAKKSESSSSGAPAVPVPTPAEPDQAKVDASVADASITNTLAILTGAGAGTELEVPPNAVPVGTKVEMRLADSAPTAFAAAGDAASAAIFMNVTDQSGADVKPVVAMTVALVIGSGGAALTGVDKVDDNLCAALENTAGAHFVWRRGALELASGKARFKTKEMGTFQLIYCGTTALDGFVEVGATGDTKEAATTVLEGTWKSGCIVDQNSKLRFDATADGLRLSISLAGLYSLEANHTYTIPQDFPQVEFFAEATAGPASPVSFAATSGSFTIDTIDAAGISGTFDSLASFTNGYTGDDIIINFSSLPKDGSAGGTMGFQNGGHLGDLEFGTQNLLSPSLKFDGGAYVRELAFVKDELKLKESIFVDADCKVLAQFDDRLYSFAVGEAATVDTKPVTKLDLTVKSIKRTAVAADVVINAKNNMGCGLTDWVANVERDITGSTACHARAAGAVVHQFFGVAGNTLKLGEEKADGSLPTNYDDEYEYLK